MLCTEGLFTGLTLFISTHQRMNRARQLSRTCLLIACSSSKLMLRLMQPSLTVHGHRLASSIKKTDFLLFSTSHLKLAGLGTGDTTTHLPLPCQVCALTPMKGALFTNILVPTLYPVCRGISAAMSSVAPIPGHGTINLEHDNPTSSCILHCQKCPVISANIVALSVCRDHAR